MQAQIASRLSERRPEIEDAVITRVLSLAGGPKEMGAEYTEGLRIAIRAAIGHAIEAIELGGERVPPVPPELLAQAARAARNGVSLEVVLRRYFAGHALISDFVVEEAGEPGRVNREGLRRLLRTQGTVLDRVTATIAAEHTRETDRLHRTTRRRRLGLVEKLLAGELPDTSSVPYEFEAHHVGLVARGVRAEEAIRELATGLDRRLLSVEHEEETHWAWLGGTRRLDTEEVIRLARTRDSGVRLAVGEPAAGIDGWRGTHRQACAALPIAVRGSESVVRYADVAVLASTLQDDLLCDLLRAEYLAPLERERDGGERLRETLCAYFAAGRNAASAAAILGISRQAASGRLRRLEERLRRSLASCVLELEVALRLAQLREGPSPRPAGAKDDAGRM